MGGAAGVLAIPQAVPARSKDFASADSAFGKTTITGQLNDWLASSPLFNIENAHKVLTRHGFDALLVSGPINLYHLTSIRPVTNEMFPRPFEAYALLCKDEKQPVRLLMNDFQSYFLAADETPGDWLETRIYTGPGQDDPAEPRPPFMLRIPQDAKLSYDEQSRRDHIARMTQGRALSPASGLVDMLRDAGLADGRVATDSAIAPIYCEAAGFATSFFGADQVLGEIRRLKSPIEIELMRFAASTNARAAMQASKSLRGGQHHSDLRSAYFEQASILGGKGVFMAIDRATSVRFDRELSDGQAFLIDGVSEFHGYHGDFGRTVFIGEPSRRMAKAVNTIGLAWKSIREKMQIGATYGELISAGHEAIRRSGQDLLVAFNVHSVGLWHTDDPFEQSEDRRLNTRLEEGMVLSIDCPLFDEGIGGSAHFEDLTLVTREGPVSLNEQFPEAIIV